MQLNTYENQGNSYPCNKGTKLIIGLNARFKRKLSKGSEILIAIIS